jgi:hypothetical protein
MNKIKTTAVVFFLSSSAASFAFADAGHGGRDGSSVSASPMHNNGNDMMQMMRQLHTNMMDGQGMGMGMMMGSGMKGFGSSDLFRNIPMSKLAEFDADGNGTLSISEFETLHSALIRESMVDRFQHLDANGDGQITSDVLARPADRRERHWMNGREHQSGQMTPGTNGMMKNETDSEDDN